MKHFVESFLCETMASLYYKILTLKKGYNIQNTHKSRIFCADNVYLLGRCGNTNVRPCTARLQMNGSVSRLIGVDS